MKDIRFEKLPDDTTILAIGSLFRRIDKSQWGVNLDLTPKATTASLSLSNIPILARKRVLNPASEYRPAGSCLAFTIDNTRTWQRKTLGDYPVPQAIRTMDKRQYCFCFFANDIEIYLPQLELARVLFLHDGYLARSALEPDYLRSEFLIEHVSPDLARVKVLPSSSYPLKSLGDLESRRLLSWILIDPDASASYQSIGRSQKLNGYEQNGYRQWAFEFTPPPLSSASFEVRGRIDKDTKTMFVYEVAGLRNIQANVPSTVEFFHPKLRENVRGEGKSGGLLVGEYPDIHSVHDGVEADADTSPVLLQAPAVAFEFSNAFNTRKVAEKKQESAQGKIEEGLGSLVSADVSTEEPVVGGVLACAEWVMGTDQTDDLHLYVSKFDCFELMLDQLVTTHGCTIKSKQLRKLPKLHRCNRHLLSEGNPRCLAVVEVAFKNQIFHILEVDTSDGVCSLSTQLLKLTSPQTWKEQLKLLEKELIQKSLSWPSKRLSELCGEDGYFGIPHPQTKSVDKGKLPEESIKHWAARVYSWMTSI